jgi:hypothetical protein
VIFDEAGQPHRLVVERAGKAIAVTLVARELL